MFKVEAMAATLPGGYHLHETHTLHAGWFLFWDGQALRHLRVYTHGSAMSSGGEKRAAWGMAIVGETEHATFVRVGIAAGRVKMPQENGWIGACNANSHTELTGMIFGLLAAATFPSALPETIHCDATAAEGTIGGPFQAHLEQELATFGRCLAIHVSQTRCLQTKHVAGHAGNPWNALADSVARAACTDQPWGSLPVVETSLHRLAEKIRWTWLHELDNAGRPMYPDLRDGLVVTGDMPCIEGRIWRAKQPS